MTIFESRSPDGDGQSSAVSVVGSNGFTLVATPLAGGKSAKGDAAMTIQPVARASNDEPSEREPAAGSEPADSLSDYYQTCPLKKPTRKVKKARQRIRVRPVPKKERQQRDAVRAACVERDGHCAVEVAFWGHRRGWPGEIHDHCGRLDGWTEHCSGVSEWAHMHSRRRSKTRGMDPSYRHDTAHSLMLCRRHHEDYDAKRLVITALTRKGANGALKFRRAKASRPPLEAKA